MSDSLESWLEFRKGERVLPSAFVCCGCGGWCDGDVVLDEPGAAGERQYVCAACDEEWSAEDADGAEGRRCPACDEEMDRSCGSGALRCPTCDGPCPCCYDGGMDEEDEEDEEDAPDEGDLVTENDRHFYQYGKLAFTVGEGEDRDEAIRRYCDAEKFWPNAWSLSDHGNFHRIEL